jgi:hypothetical protein
VVLQGDARERNCIRRAQPRRGKLFEGLYALYCGLAVISVAAIIFAPVIHRFMHKLHADPSPDSPERHRLKKPAS